MTETRFITADEAEPYLDAVRIGFGQDPSTDDDRVDRFLAINPLETCSAAFDRGRVVATFGSYDLDMTVPGAASVAAAGTSHVTVHPTHRRRGILRDLMTLHLDQARDRGQSMAALWASEERIYGRFGYGPATWALDIAMSARTVDLPPVAEGVEVHPLPTAEAATVLAPLFEAGRIDVAGRFVRSDAWWANRTLYDHAHRSDGERAQRYVVAERDGEVVGYLIYRLSDGGDWNDGNTGVVELMTRDDAARRALWHFVTNIDLFRNVRWWNAPVDDPVLIEAERFRSAKHTTFDAVWVRPLDVATLLSTRGYERDGALVLGVDDPAGYTGGRFRLEVVDGKGSCSSTTDEPSVTLGVADLGRLYLGAGSALTLARAGRIDGAPEAVATLGDLLATRRQPHVAEVF
ncbi:MAG: GNAT family N-acetyltransferase [Actinomycetota bacterium]